jgi:hypothetical protein
VLLNLQISRLVIFQESGTVASAHSAMNYGERRKCGELVNHRGRTTEVKSSNTKVQVL